MYFSLDIIVIIVYNVSKSREEIQRNNREIRKSQKKLIDRLSSYN
nr:MAG TPA: hypothetical protein [Caudoviricetes sp.]